MDATIIAAPSSTKNADGERDPEMHQTKKGNQWHFGMKAHIGVDADSGLVHTVTTTPANEADVEQVEELLHGKEEVVHADAGYTGADKRVERKGLRWQIAAKRGKIKAMKDGREKRALEKSEKRKAQIRARVEHPFRVIKRQFGCMKVRFRGLVKNTAHVITLFALSNLWMARRRLLAMTGIVASAAREMREIGQETAHLIAKSIRRNANPRDCRRPKRSTSTTRISRLDQTFPRRSTDRDCRFQYPNANPVPLLGSLAP